jgi:general secretion pathway protein C
MRLAIDPRRWRLLRRLPRSSLVSLTELALLALLAVQCARLFWALVTPIGPLGDWKPATGPSAERGRAVLASGFDPFFRLGDAGGPALVTSLQLKLFGVRLNEATGLGSAIIAGADNVQTSYSVGEPIQPGVVLKSVGYDNVVIAHEGRDETLYLDQSGGAQVAAPAAPAPANITLLSAPAIEAAPTGAVTLSQLRSQLTLAPRQAGGRVTGLVPRGDASFLARLGLRPGDVVVQVAGRPIGSADDLQRAAAGLAPGGTLSIAVERGAQIVPLAISISGQ